MTQYRPEIDGLRAIAITSVLLFHAGIISFSGGYVGVDIFFVISGYLITSIIYSSRKQGTFSFADFYARRARRILPALLFALFVTTALFAAFLPPQEMRGFGSLLLSTVFFVANFNLSGEPGYFDVRSHDNPLLHMWSLSVEEQFYFIWPPILLLLCCLRRGQQTRAIILGMFALSLFISAYWLWKSPRLSFYHLPSRGFELLAGAILAVGAVPQPRSRLLAELACSAGLILMIGPMLLYSRDTPFPGFAALPPVLGCALVIWAETSWSTRIGAVLKLRPVVFIGLISFSLYLWHWPLLCLPRNILFRPLTSAETAACLAAATAISILSWRFIEQPFRRGGERAIYLPPVFAGLRLSAAGVAGIMLAASLAGFGLLAKETGALWRWSQATVDFLADTRREDGHAASSYTITHSRKRDTMLETRPSGRQLTDPGAFFLWGDSHTGNFAGALQAALGPGTIFFIPGCLPVLNVTWISVDGRSRMEGCTEFKKMAMEAIAQRKPKLIILAARWIQADGLSYELVPRFVGFLKENESDPETQAHSREIFVRNLRSTVENSYCDWSQGSPYGTGARGRISRPQMHDHRGPAGARPRSL